VNAQANRHMAVDARGCGNVDNRTARPARPQDEGLIVTLPRYRTFRSRRDRAKG
jgi:hypothetical protein